MTAWAKNPLIRWGALSVVLAVVGWLAMSGGDEDVQVAQPVQKKRATTAAAKNETPADLHVELERLVQHDTDDKPEMGNSAPPPA